MAINDKDFYASHGINYDVEEMQIEYTKRVIQQAKIEVLTELQLEIDELDSRAGYSGNGMPTFSTDYIRKKKVSDIIQQKINSLKVEIEPQESEDKESEDKEGVIICGNCKTSVKIKT